MPKTLSVSCYRRDQVDPAHPTSALITLMNVLEFAGYTGRLSSDHNYCHCAPKEFKGGDVEFVLQVIDSG